MKRSEIATTIQRIAATLCVGVVFVTAIAGCRRGSDLSLPALQNYSERSPQFNERLRQLMKDDSPSAAQIRDIGRLYQANRLLDQAAECYKILAATPRELTAQDLYYFARLEADRSRVESSIESLKRVAGEAPEYLPAKILLAESLFKSGRSDEARGAYDEILKREPDHFQANLGLVRIDLQQAAEDRAIERLEKLIVSAPNSSSAAALLCQVLERKGQKERSAALRELSRRRPDPIPADPWLDRLYDYCFDAQLLSLRFESFVFAGQNEQALPLLKRVEALDDKSWVPVLVKGWMLAQSHRLPEAEAAFRTALGRGGDPEKIVPQLASALVAEGKTVEARRGLDEALSKAPNSVSLMSMSAQLAIKANDITSARTTLEKILSLEPYLPTQNFDLAHILWEAGDHDAAAACLLRVAKAFPNDTASRGWLGQYYMDKGDDQRAITVLETSLRISDLDKTTVSQLKSELVPALFRSAQKAEASGNLSDAEKGYRKIESYDSSNVQARAALANILTALGRSDDAIVELKELSRLQPNNPTIPLSQGDILWQDGKPKEAVETWKAALRLLREGDAEIKNALEQRIRRANTAGN